MTRWDSPHWSYFSGCRLHPGQVAPCQLCIDMNHPDLVDLDKEKTFQDPCSDQSVWASLL